MGYPGDPQDMQTLTAALAERIRRLEALLPIVGPMGPTGPAGSATYLSTPWQLIGSLVVTAPMSPVAVVSFPLLPLGAHHLVLFHKVRSSAAVTNQALNAQFNSDSGANYYWQLTDSVNATATPASGVGQTSMRVGIVPGSTATAGLFGGGRMDFPNYSDSNYQIGLAHSGAPTSLLAAGQVMEDSFGFWANGSPLNRLDVFPAAGGLITGSSLWLYSLV